nr:hypothetical protein GCM10020185_64780 [Pseudomonas brassicacearum subsp. brassicacearum]
MSDTEPDQGIIERLLPSRQNREQRRTALVGIEPGFNQPSHQIERRKASTSGCNVPLAYKRLVHGFKSQSLQARSRIRVGSGWAVEQPKPFENESSGAYGADSLASGVKFERRQEIRGGKCSGYSFLAADEQYRVGTVGLAKRTVHRNRQAVRRPHDSAGTQYSDVPVLSVAA